MNSDRNNQAAARSDRENLSAARGCLAKYDRTRTLLIDIADFILRPVIRTIDLLSKPHCFEVIRKILVLESGQIGDAVLLSPFLRNLRMNYPSARVTLAARQKVAPLMQDQGLIDEFFPFEVPWGAEQTPLLKYNPLLPGWRKLARFMSLLRRKQFDIAFCAKGDLRDNLLIWLTRAARRVGYGFYGGGFFLTDAVVPNLEHPHYLNRWLRLLEHLNGGVGATYPRLEVSSAQEKFAQRYLAEKGIRENELLVGIHSGARLAVRQWGRENFRMVGSLLAAQFPVRILWFQEPGANETDEHRADFINISLPLREFMAVLARCSFLISNDSGPAHIATAIGVPVLAILGPTKREWFGPVGEQNTVLINDRFWCRPCGDNCIFDQPYCLKTISRDRVFAAASALVSRFAPATMRPEAVASERAGPR
jgi:heptosyltransferase II